MEAYPSDIHKALTLKNEYKPLKIDVAPVHTQGTAFAATSCKGKGKKASGRTKYISNFDWKAMHPEAQIAVGQSALPTLWGLGRTSTERRNGVGF